MITAMITGNIGKDATLRDAGGQTVCSFGVASTTKVKGEKVTQWVDCSIWGKRAETLNQYLSKGTRVAIVGELSTREHNGKTYLQCRVDQLDLMGGGTREQGQPQPSSDDNGRDDIPF